MSEFVSRYITAIIGIGTGRQGDGPPVEFTTLTGFRVMADITAYGGETQGQATIRIYGMSESLMNQLTTIGPIMTQLRGQNSLQILAGTDPAALSTVYLGTIQTAFANYNEAPDVPLEIMAWSALDAALTPAQASSFSGFMLVDTIMRGFAKQLGWGYVNAGVDAGLYNPYFGGSTLDQIKACARAAGIDYSTDNKVLSIKNPFDSYPGVVPVVSPSSGMVGYPTLSSSGMFVKSLFFPDIRQGGQIQVKDSHIKSANGTWAVSMVHHELESIVPNGKWFTTCQVFANASS